MYRTMKTIAVLLSLLAISKAATIVPVDSSVVNVKTEHAGQDYSYSIHENHGYAINPTGTLRAGIPVIKSVVPEISGVSGVHGIPITKSVVPEIPGVSGVHGVPEHIHVEQHEVRPQSLAKAVAEHPLPDHGIPLGSYPTTYLSYTPISYQYGLPYGYTYPYNILSYRIAK